MNRVRALGLTTVLGLPVGPSFLAGVAVLFFVTSVHAQKAPDDVEGLQMWLRADTIGFSDGDPVDVWFDDSGNNRSAEAIAGGITNSFAPRIPTFRENPVNVLNGLPVVHFDGTTGNPDEDPSPSAGDAVTYIGDDGAPLGYDDLTSEGLTYFMVASVDNKSIEDAGIYAPDSQFNAVFTLPHKAGIGDRVQIQRQGGNPSFARIDALDLKDFNIVAGSMTSIQPDEENTKTVYLNSAIPGDRVTGTNTGREVAPPPLGFWGQHGQYDVAEVLIYDRALGPDEIGGVGYGLAQKYGLPGFEEILPRHLGSTDPETEGFRFTGNGDNLSEPNVEEGYWRMNVTKASRYQGGRGTGDDSQGVPHTPDFLPVEFPDEFTVTFFGHVNELVSGSFRTGLSFFVQPEGREGVNVSFVGEAIQPEHTPDVGVGDPYTQIVDVNGCCVKEVGPERSVDVDVTQDHIYQITRSADGTYEFFIDGEKAFEPQCCQNMDNPILEKGFIISTLASSTTVSDSEWRLLEARRGVRIYRPGNTDFDEDVDFTDFSSLAGNFTGTLPLFTGGKEWEQGDFNFDGAVAFDDFSQLAGNFTGTVTAPSGDTASGGDVHLEINYVTGTLTLQPTNADLAGYSIRSPDSQLVPDADGVAAPFLFYLLNAPQEVTAGSVGSTTMLTDDLVLDITFAGDQAQAANLVFQYTRAGEVSPVDGIVHIVPEPATLILLAAGGLLVMPRRRRSA